MGAPAAARQLPALIFTGRGMFQLFRAPCSAIAGVIRVSAWRVRGGGRMSGPCSGGFATLVRPMLATPARELPADCESWAAEFKWDGLLH
jgi:hypothetical protein